VTASLLTTYEERTWRASSAEPVTEIDLFIEVPHGATRTEHFTEVRERLKGELPPDLDAFYFVNTDVGTPEGAEILADMLTKPDRIDGTAALRSVRVLRGIVPRTFADFNRVLDAHDALEGEGWNPAVPNYVRDADDREFLEALHRDYDGAAHRIHDEVCSGGGFSLILHSYAPRSVGVQVDDNIVTALRGAYQPEVYETWPERPAIEAITEMPDGRQLTDSRLVRDAELRYAEAGLRLALNETYKLHPATSGTVHSLRWPEKTLSIELNRALCVPDFIPFVELETDREAITRLVSPLASALRRHLVGAPEA